MTPDTWGASDTPCTCNYGGTHDPANPECDRAILDGTAGPVYAEAPLAEHRLQNLNATGDMARCIDCDEVITGDNPLKIHLHDLRARQT